MCVYDVDKSVTEPLAAASCSQESQREVGKLARILLIEAAEDSTAVVPWLVKQTGF